MIEKPEYNNDNNKTPLRLKLQQHHLEKLQSSRSAVGPIRAILR